MRQLAADEQMFTAGGLMSSEGVFFWIELARLTGEIATFLADAARVVRSGSILAKCAKMIRKREPDSGKRVRRLLQMMLLLHEGRGTSGDELARRFGVSRRTIFRDVQLLRDTGIPISNSTEGGYILNRHDVRSIRLRPLELVAVACADDDPQISRLTFLRQAREVALAKLMCDSPVLSRAQIEFVRERLSELTVNSMMEMHESVVEDLIESWIEASGGPRRK